VRVVLAARRTPGMDCAVFQESLHALDGRPGVEGGRVVHVGEQGVVGRPQSVEAKIGRRPLAPGDGLALLHRLDVRVGMDGQELREGGEPWRFELDAGRVEPAERGQQREGQHVAVGLKRVVGAETIEGELGTIDDDKALACRPGTDFGAQG